VVSLAVKEGPDQLTNRARRFSNWKTKKAVASILFGRGRCAQDTVCFFKPGERNQDGQVILMLAAAIAIRGPRPARAEGCAPKPTRPACLSPGEVEGIRGTIPLNPSDRKRGAKAGSTHLLLRLSKARARTRLGPSAASGSGAGGRFHGGPPGVVTEAATLADRPTPASAGKRRSDGRTAAEAEQIDFSQMGDRSRKKAWTHVGRPSRGEWSRTPIRFAVTAIYEGDITALTDMTQEYCGI